MDPARRRELRLRAIERHLPLVDHCLRDFRPSNPELREDALQAGRIGLILAVDRFDPRRGIAFRHYARPTINGEILHFLRDRGPTIRVPRRYHDLTHAARSCREHVRHQLGHEPSLSDLAHFLGIAVEEVEAAFAAEAACAPRSLDHPAPARSGEPLAGKLDAQLESVPERHDLREALALLTDVERFVLTKLFVQGLPQARVAALLGRPQMYVSRTRKRALVQLAEFLRD